MKPRLRVLAIVACLSLSGCADWPRDQSGTTSRVRQTRVLAVGASENNDKEYEKVRGQEKRLVEKIAAKLGARIEWRRGNVHTLLEELEERKIAIVAAQIPDDSPFSQSVGMTQPFVERGPNEKSYALAVAPGENELLLLADRIIAQEKRGAESAK